MRRKICSTQSYRTCYKMEVTVLAAINKTAIISSDATEIIDGVFLWKVAGLKFSELSLVL